MEIIRGKGFLLFYLKDGKRDKYYYFGRKWYFVKVENGEVCMLYYYNKLFILL